MSGPKSVSFTVPLAIAAAPVALAAGAAAQVAMVAQEAARQRRARAAALEARVEELRARAAGLSRKLSTIAGQWQAARDRHGAEFPAWPHGAAASPELIASLGSPEDLERCIRDLTRRATQARIACATQSTMFRMRTSPQSAAGESARTEEHDRERCAEEVSRLIDELAAEASSEDRAAIEQQAQEAVEAPRASRRKALLVQLRLDIQRANEAGRARRRTAEQVEGWRERLVGLAGTEVAELDAALRRVLAGEEPLPRDMEQRVDDAVAGANAAATRDYALGVVREELENLGYVVEAGFRTASPEAPEMLLSKPDMGDGYHVSLRAASGAATLDARVVREADGLDAEGPSDPDRARADGEAERAWCRDLAAALAAAEGRGLRARVVERTAAGKAPVQTIAPLRSGHTGSKKKSRRKRTRQLKARAAR